MNYKQRQILLEAWEVLFNIEESKKYEPADKGLAIMANAMIKKLLERHEVH